MQDSDFGLFIVSYRYASAIVLFKNKRKNFFKFLYMNPYDKEGCVEFLDSSFTCCSDAFYSSLVVKFSCNKLVRMFSYEI